MIDVPVVDVYLWDLERLVKRDLSVKEIEEILPKVKCEIEEIEDELISYEATHDRPDLYSAEGLSIALRGLLEVEKGLPRYRVRGVVSKGYVEGPDYRPYVLFATVYGVSLDDESIRQLMQLQEKIHITYGRDRRKVSIGLYDLKEIKLPVKYVAVDPKSVKFPPLDFKEEMTPLEILRKHPKGIAYKHLVEGKEKVPLIVDAEGKVVSFPPIVNSEEFRVTQETTDILIDVTSIDLNAARKVISIIVTAVAERGGEIGLIEMQAPWGKEVSPRLDPETINYDVSLNKKLLGLDLGVSETISLLEKMRMNATALSDETLEVKYPFYRTDILHQVDIAEEVAMAYGYENIEPQVMRPLHPGKENGLEVFTRSIREAMVGLGFLEINNYMMTNTMLMFDKMNIQRTKIVEVSNPRHEAFHALRNWIIPQLLNTLANSKHAGYPQRIFETGDIVLVTDKDEILEEKHLAFLLADKKITLTDGLAILKALFELYGLKYELKPGEHPSFIPGRFAEVIVNGTKIGFIGEIHPLILLNFELEVPIVASELDIDKIRQAYLGLLH
ncbi:MAG: phenylalanine--tRNA ligase subunit beta [Thermoprotei archaeon]|nr:MAG: phenylalanine--tRNA ligase subunit beta [Thermoprotei archaeon]